MITSPDSSSASSTETQVSVFCAKGDVYKSFQTNASALHGILAGNVLPQIGYTHEEIKRVLHELDQLSIFHRGEPGSPRPALDDGFRFEREDVDGQQLTVFINLFHTYLEQCIADGREKYDQELTKKRGYSLLNPREVWRASA